ncbi:type III chaperone protein ShcF [Pseudomonas coronafaciens pv. porri]|uniref:Type III chaperone protein ShcF n=1 Tax=Pseudomonas coronafaciens pv. porri TaxID=83964 RepID=A0ABR5JT49_9PSED|nr:CesT family type III secretion system chaperone [Pseudomonas coronafaciens]KOP52560.1 type III chaperone protein ShcF [Pseudomonas coronafaciens pv. porri]KOP60712.1 type III chaperone protein ShcF [Pseudomonas coronafaciens pv. porri]RMU84578.1 Type III chaperone protein ShcF [Pseudomonas coronafaciens pv. porri]RMW01355.1 Type III chaperone protein ShcF [Pseudomonas coronafaciens pv. porri]RMW12053.1 Type III chaperone protein ShcF [Pseudomonas coronafaciens pv. porri]
MKNSFDRLVEGLAKDYSMPNLPDKKNDNEVYCFEFQSGIEIKVYQDESRWVSFVAEIGKFQSVSSDALSQALQLNNFSFRKPFITFGMNSEKGGVLHTRIPLIEMNNVEMRKVFEDLLEVAVGIRKKFNLA